MLLSALVMLNFWKLTAWVDWEMPMEFTFHTTYNQKALTAMARAVRKTTRAKTSRRVRLYAWLIIGLLLVSLWLSWGEIWKMAVSCIALAAFLLVNWKEDAINGYFAKRKALPGTDCADTICYPDYFLVKTAVAETQWQYDSILALAETKDYILFVMGKNHALAIEKAALAGGSIQEFCRFIQEKSGQKLQNIGG